MISRSQPPFVYFVRRQDGCGPVKIGCSQFPEARLAALMVWAPYPLVIAATTPGDETLERRFHALFEAQHSHREWFHPSPALDSTIRAVANEVFDVEQLPAPKVVTNPKKRRPISAESKRGMSWTHRLRHLARRGIQVPADVSRAAFRWSAGPFSHDYRPHDPADAEVVEAFLKMHPRRADRRRSAA